MDESEDKQQAVQGVLGFFASTRTAIVLLALIAMAALAGTVLPDAAAQKYIYGRTWFHMLLGLLGLDLLVCMVWRKRIGLARIWSLLAHTGILLVLIGAMVTLIWAERGAIVIREGQELSAFVPEVGHGQRGKPEPLGFGVKLLDFRITHYPPADYLLVMKRGVKPTKLHVAPGRPLDIPGTEYRLTGVAFLPEGGNGVVEVTMLDGTRMSIPAAVGSTQELGGEGLALKILRYEPSFKIDIETREVSSDSAEPNNPAVRVALVRDGADEEPHWLFARAPDFGHTGHGAGDPALPGMRYLHPRFPLLVAEVETPSGVLPVRLENGKGTPSPWDPALVLVYERRAGPVKEYESEVEVLQDGRVVGHHVIQVNDPLVYEGTKLSQSGYDDKGLRWSKLGVSRDSGVWFVYAGFLTMMVGIVGRFYVSPITRRMRAGPKTKGGDDGSS